ncbi:hypothetical protein PUNSTDRAFT_122407 [Punctularia strigosozonata HHB-11173 SS5]|uniref:uncharacterized protein n=1 Tax=Punctularia strigosozonata (strain HHB-11173) TaxID=741275 RepID=UPI000441630A|nr:uncharacterized protein PUNSTDRAFT_122407 [Punctularia strigosozonata HHB-11173 SS5]EIN05530.1 hypothetical protein PUNSTDRAFT_122407 [Punctularia strigosozonata HHB-11173 SS5]
MDYDRYDAFLHHIFKQTQGDAWFRPNEENLTGGVALRVADGEFRVFPYENITLEPFEAAVAALNPVVAVKIRSAAVHAALAEVTPEDKSIYVDANTRIQIIETMMQLPQAEREQCGAFIRDERVLIVWSDSLDQIIPTCHDFEERLIKLLWRSRPHALGVPSASSHHNSVDGSVSGHSLSGLNAAQAPTPSRRGTLGYMGSAMGSSVSLGLGDPEKSAGLGEKRTITKTKRTWYGRKRTVVVEVDEEDLGPEERPARLFSPFYNGIAAGLALVFMGNGVATLLKEWLLDGDFTRFALAALIPCLYAVSLFFALQIVQNLSMAVGPVAQYHENSKYYSANKPRPNKVVDNNLPHITIQMPVYKESLHEVLAPSIESLKKCMQTYARQGGTSTIFINDDGLRVLDDEARDERIAFYANHNIGWVARPKHDDAPDGFKRAGRFKKASNMNYGLALSLKIEKHLEALQAEEKARNPDGLPGARISSSTNPHDYQYPGFGLQYQGVGGGEQGQVGQVAQQYEDIEEKALQMAIEEVYENSGRRFRPWAANGKSCRVGELILIVDSDTVVPEDCLRDAAREMAECPTVGVIQHESDVMQVAHHYFENGIAYFTRRINRCISFTCANGEVAPFVGHNAFLRWRALQDAAFVDTDGVEKIWSESNVSEDFDMALRLQMRGFIIRWATYSNGGFKEGVSLTVDDELNRWQKYSYGCSELLFNPIIQWWRRGPIAHQIHRFMWSNAPMHYKISMMAYMFSYYGIAASMTIGILNYVLLGFQFPVDGYYMHSFEIWLATTVVFIGSGNVGYTLLEYRLGHKGIFEGFFENVLWVPFFFFFFGGLAIPVSQSILAHLFSYNMTWAATKKEVERSNFFKEVPKILKRFWFPFLVSIVVIAGMIICATPLVPIEWRVDGSGWAVIFPLAIVASCHILFPIVLNPWLLKFSY